MELSGISPSEAWRFSQRRARIIPGVLFLFFLLWVLGASQIDFGAVEVDDFWPTCESLGSIFPVVFFGTTC